MPIKNQKGIALVLSVLILANLFIITIIVTDVILRVGKTSQQIGESEIAYFSAESAIEDAIYQIEKNDNATNIGTIDDEVSGNLSQTDGTWQSYIEPIFTTPVTCVDQNNVISYHTVSSLDDLITDLGASFNDSSCVYAEDFSSSSPISNTNALIAMISPGRSFELDLKIAVPETIDFYPHHFNVNWVALPVPYGSGSSDPSGNVIVLTSTAQDSYQTESLSSLRVPATGNLGTSPDRRLRVINKDTEHVSYSFSPSGSDYLPVGIAVTAKGYYKDSGEKERIIVVERRNWEIY